MKNKKSFAPFLSIALIFVLVGAAAFSAQEQPATKLAESRGEGGETSAPDNRGVALGSGLISLLPGQSARLAAVNGGRKEIPLELAFVPVTEQGKAGASILCDSTPAPGDVAFDKFTHPGGVNRALLYVQVRVRQNANDIKDLVPSVEIINEQTGAVEHILSGADFVGIGLL